ncbi:MAG: hypothetical protein WCA78_15385 [Rhizomicrobium sp.]
MGSRLKLAILAGATLAAISVPTLAANDPFLAAVTFALTGSDDADVQIIDRAHCVFALNAKTINGEVRGEIFYLNNVDAGRLKFQPWQNIAGKWIEVELHGSSVVYKFTGDYEMEANSVLDQQTQEKLQGLTRPRQADTFTIKIYTDEYQRVIRAWNYLYAHGCTSQKSPF